MFLGVGATRPTNCSTRSLKRSWFRSVGSVARARQGGAGSFEGTLPRFLFSLEVVDVESARSPSRIRDQFQPIMLTLTRTSLIPLGLHFGLRSATVVQLAGTAERLELRKAARCRLPHVAGLAPDDAECVRAESVRRLIADQRLIGRKVVSCLSADELFIETVRLPQLPPDEIAKLIRVEAAERLPYPIDDAEVRHLLVGEVKQDNVAKQEVILIATPREAIRRRLRLLEQVGLAPVGIDIEPCAWLRSLHHASHSTVASRMAYLFCGEATSTVMFTEGSRVLFMKSFPVGGDSFDAAVSQSLDVDLETASSMRADVFAQDELNGEDEVHRAIIEALRPGFDALVAEFELCLRYYKVTFRGRLLDNLIVSGTEAAPWFAEYLGDRVGLKSQALNPFDGLRRTAASAKLQRSPGQWAVALGLALKRIP